MKVFAVVLLAVAISTVLGQAPDDCSINIRDRSNVTTSFEGTRLNYCRRSERQCCSNNYFAQAIRELRQGLLGGLREQISANGDVLNGISWGLRNYINRVFIPRLLVLLEAPINNITQNVSTYNDTLRSRFFIRPNHPGEVNFTVQGFTQSFIDSQINLLIHSVVRPFVAQNNGSGMSLPDQQQICARTIFRRHVNMTTKMRVDRSIQELRLAITAIDRVRSWFDLVFLPNLTRLFNPLDVCYRAFIDIRCQDCVANIPRTCRGVCNAITYGCYSVIQNGLSGQFNVLWNVTNQLVRISREAVRNVSAVLPDNLLTLNFGNTTQVIQVLAALRSECSINLVTSSNVPLPQPRTLNASDIMIDIPATVVRNASILLRRGLVYYNNGALHCRMNTNTNCWNGNATVPTFVPTFNGTSIDAQANNPYFNVSIDVLRREVISLGNPVTDYLSTNTSFQEVAPQELVIPEDTPYTGSGAGSLMMSTFLMVFLTIFYVVTFA